MLIPLSGRVHLKGRGLLDPTWVQGAQADRPNTDKLADCTQIKRVHLIGLNTSMGAVNSKRRSDVYY